MTDRDIKKGSVQPAKPTEAPKGEPPHPPPGGDRGPAHSKEKASKNKLIRQKQALEKDLVKLGIELARFNKAINPQLAMVQEPIAIFNLLVKKSVLMQEEIDVEKLTLIKQGCENDLSALRRAEIKKPGPPGLRPV